MVHEDELEGEIVKRKITDEYTGDTNPLLVPNIARLPRYKTTST